MVIRKWWSRTFTVYATWSASGRFARSTGRPASGSFSETVSPSISSCPVSVTSRAYSCTARAETLPLHVARVGRTAEGQLAAGFAHRHGRQTDASISVCMQHLPVISRGIASSIPTPAQTCSQLFVQGLICLTALDDVVRAAAYRLLVAIVDSGKIACPDLPTLKGVLLRL
jgi:hypothetical protein